MSIITTVEAMPNRISMACEALSFFGAKGCSRDRLELLLSPIKHAANTDGDGSTISKKIINELLILGFAKKDGETIRLHEDLFDIQKKNLDWIETLRPILLNRLTNMDNSRKYGQALVPMALAWLLAQDPYTGIRWNDGHLVRMNRQFINGDHELLDANGGMRNNARYQNLVSWARYLGLAERINDIVIPDPSYMIIDNWTQIFGGSKEWHISEFIARLASFCPVLDTGTVRVQLERQLKEIYRVDHMHLSQSLSLSLKRLVVKGTILLEHRADAESMILHIGTQTEMVSSIRLINGGVQ